jgi:hypothetical protein
MVLMVLVGCDALQPQDATDAGASDVAGAAADAVGAVGTSAGAAGDATISRQEQCQPQQPLVADEITVTVHNGRAQTVLLGPPTLCQREYIKITSVANPAQLWEGINCRHDCSGARLGDQRCSADCPKPDPLPLAPGQTHAVSWTPVLYARVLLLQECCAQPSGVCSRECYQPSAAEPGAYTLTLALIDEHHNLLEQLDLPIQLGNGHVSVTIE